MPFSEKSLDYLIENRLHDSKEWYHEHKNQLDKYISQPFYELISELTPTMLEIDEQIICNPKKHSRMYRDTRFSKDKSLFRENVWCIFGRAKIDFLPPSFYFDISPHGFEYGCGFYYAGTATMEEVRKMILSKDKAFTEAFNAVNNQDVFELYGDLFKRNRFPEQSEELCSWLNRKNIGLSCSSKDFELLFSGRLSQKLAEDYKKIAEFYRFIVKADSLSRQKD